MFSFRKVILYSIIAILICVVAAEIKTSYLQSIYFSKVAKSCSYKVNYGRGKVIFPKFGPKDERLGYTSIGNITEDLSSTWEVHSQANWSRGALILSGKGISPPYKEKQSTGLEIYDAYGNTVYTVKKPNNLYRRYEDIPELLIKSLLFIESAEMLSGGENKNVVIEWDRLIENSISLILKKMGLPNTKVNGASTLATQIEKYEHSNKGRTEGIRDKLNQMMSASIRLYRNGRNTTISRKEIILNYINSIPLGSVKGNGEVIGFGDGILLWFGRNFLETNKEIRLQKPEFFKEALSLIISVRRPNYYLKHPNELDNLTNKYIGLMLQKGVIGFHLYQEAVEHKIEFSQNIINHNEPIDKNTLSIKRNLMSLLKKENYSINTMDVSATSTINKKYQDKVAVALHSLDKKKLMGERLLSSRNKLEKLIYSFSFYEMVGNNNFLRIQVDSLPDEFNLNDSSKLELGSTAKLRTLITYLDLVSEIWKNKEFNGSPLSIWVSQQKVGSLKELMDAALQRKVSGSPAEGFYTGSGLHYFSNFEGKYNGVSTVAEGLQRSVNLIFIRLMRDIILHLQARNPNSRYVWINGTPQRKEYIQRFINLEVETYLHKFIQRHQGLTKEQSFSLLMKRVPKYPFRLATIFRTVYPEKGIAEFKKFIGGTPKIEELYEKYQFGKFNWQDLGYITRLHPMELWLVAGKPTRKETVISESYKWIWHPRKLRAQNRGITQILEIEAFGKLLPYWKKLGYPFKKLTPSLATAIGSSGDNPTALSNLIGILLHKGRYCPNRRFSGLHFAKETPYETNLIIRNDECPEVLPSEVTEAALSAMRNVVEKGTAVRIRNIFKDREGNPLEVGGKTGTGDNRIKRTGKVLNRTGTFTFHIGRRYFGALTIFVQGKDAAGFTFTSSLPLQVLKLISPELQQMINKE